MSTALTHTPADRPADRPSPPTHPWGRRRWTLLGVVVVVAAVVVEMIDDGDWLTTAWGAVTTASPSWAAIGLAASMASMGCFGMARRVALHAADVEVPAAQAIGMSFAAGALHTTMPGGSVLATAYSVRRLRAWGASTTVAAWSLAITGLIASSTLLLFTVAGIAAGGSTSITTVVAAVATAAAIITALVLMTRRPQLLIRPATVVLRLFNRTRTRPAETGLATVLRTIDDLTAIRPTRRQWLTCSGWSLGNWILDAACLWAATAAVGVHVSMAGLVIAYTAGMVAVSVSPLPAGAGAVETAMIIALSTAGASAPAALAAVVTYRVISIGSTAAIGWTLLAINKTRHR